MTKLARLRPSACVAFGLLVPLAIAGCGSSLGNSAVSGPPSGSASSTAVGSAGQTHSGLRIELVNNNPAFANDKVNWYIQSRVDGEHKQIYGPTTLAESTGTNVDSLVAGRVVVTLGNDGSAPLFPSPDNSPFRFDQVEMTYPQTDRPDLPGLANMTAVDMVGIPMDIQVLDSTGATVATKKWTCYTDRVQEQLKRSLESVGGDFSKAVRRGLDGEFLRVVSPNIVSGEHASGYPRFDDYVDSVQDVPLTVTGIYSKQGQEPDHYKYTGKFTGPGLGTIRLTDAANPAHKPIIVTGESLVGNDGDPKNTGIYGNNSEYEIEGSKDNPHHVGDNDMYSAAYRDLVAGFAWGFWGKNKNNNGEFNVSENPGPFAGSQSNPKFYNQYASALFSETLAYAFPFGDTFNDAPDRTPIVGLPIDGTIRITIDPDVSPAGCGAPPGS